MLHDLLFKEEPLIFILSYLNITKLQDFFFTLANEYNKN